ncbi:MAG: hypothetical protein J0M15_01350 [Deltaproteobacteria bacterium]|nr:hypothetical protein [Deltaproteobacteria bacterium]
MSILNIALIMGVFLTTWLFPSTMDRRKFISLTQQVTIKTNKNSPPRIAFDAIQTETHKDEEKKNLNSNIIYLSTQNNQAPEEDPRPLLRKMVLSPINVIKEKQVIFQAPTEEEETVGYKTEPAGSDNSWMQELRPYLRKKLSESSNIQGTNKPLHESLEDEALYSETAVNLLDKKRITKSRSKSRDERIYQNVSDQSQASVDKDSVDSEKNVVVGLLEIKDGLAITNDHHIEIRRYEEGAFQEKGSFDLIQGTYQLEVAKPRGYILARLLNENGKILGEGVGRVSDVKWNKFHTHAGPKIYITKKVDIKGRTVSAYNLEKVEALSTPGKAGVFKGYVSQSLDKTGRVALDNIVAGSSTNLVSRVKGHLTTQQIIIAGAEFENIVYPQKMIESLKAMVSEQRQQNLNDPNLSVIMGQVLFDKKSMSGVRVHLENYNELEPIYFNTLMLPDSNLKTTSENGYFAFIGAPDELHHLVAFRGENYFGHVNTKVNAGILSYAKIESTVKTEEVEIKVYDAFRGQAQSAELTLQSLSEKVQVDQGAQSVFLPAVERWSLLHAKPSLDYQPAYYTYVDKTDYINVPLISKAWLWQIVSQLNIKVDLKSGMVLGFVHDENFSVEIPNYESMNKNVIYFDYAGRILKQPSGTMGGGFIIFNLPEDSLEILVLGAKSQKIYSRMTPLKAQDLYVFNFKLDN